uniref:Replication initiator protein n=1 Tax=Dulem virus 99 TaxID=3145810 RepID=A0AAU8AUX0_9VIRU
MQCISPITIRQQVAIFPGSRIKEEKFVTVPCGKCAACLCRRKRDWMNRLWFEYHDHSTGAFVTLTYDDSHLNYSVEESTGECFNTLCKRDLQLFLKRLRKQLGNGIRFFAVGEYGTTTARPHYHLLIFGYPYRCDIGAHISQAWRKGFVSVGSVSGASINYCTKYLLIGGVDKPFFDLLDLYGAERPFMVCSRRPYIGNGYVSDDIVDYHRSSGSLMIVKDAVKQPMPRIYREKIFNSFTLRKLNNELVEFARNEAIKQERKDIEKYGYHHAFMLQHQRKLEFIRRVKNKLKHNEKL